jgi:hypothetical protein
MSDHGTVTATRALEIQNVQLAGDYKYVNARGGQVGLSILHGEQSSDTYVVLHVARVQFQPAVGEAGLNTIPVNSALASVEMSLENAKALHVLLGKLLAIEPEQS